MKQRNLKASSLLALTVLGCLAACTHADGPTAPTVTSGVIDLRAWDFDRDGPVMLTGDWFFRWEAFIDPVLVPQRIEGRDGSREFVRVPSLWEDLPAGASSEETLPGTGYATAAVKILLPQAPGQQELGLSVWFQSSVFEIFEIREEVVVRPLVASGKPGMSMVDTQPGGRAIKIVPLLPAKDMVLAAHISMFRHPRGGIGVAPIIGPYEDLVRGRQQHRIYSSALIGLLLTMAIYHLGLAYRRRTDLPSWIFALLCFALATRRFVMEDGLGLIAHERMEDAAFFEWWYTLEYVSLVVIAMTGAQFVLRVVEIAWLAAWRDRFTYVCLAYLVLILVSQVNVFASFLEPFQGVGVVFFIALVAGLFQAAWRGDKLARILVVGAAAMLGAAIHDIFALRGAGNTVLLLTYASLFFILAKGYVLTERFVQAQQTAERLSVHLQEEVDRQTLALRKASERELQKSQNLLVQSEKLASLGQMVAAIGHEIANPVNLSSMSVQAQAVLLDSLEERVMALFEGADGAHARAVKQDLEKTFRGLEDCQGNALLASEKLKDLTMALRTQSRREDAAINDVSINSIVSECLILVGGRIKRFSIEESMGEDLPSLTCHRSRIGQVVTNLLSNAGDALSERQESAQSSGEIFRGTLRVETSPWERDNTTGVRVTVADNGPGVPQDIRTRIFEEFFTTKAVGVGTGLGLSMCLSIVKDHGGMLEVSDDEALGGARFDLWLPLEPPGGPHEVS